ncbi:MAG: hypothetical protein MI807_23795 [Verrucomicrobiales bacterium]|nr:hypothetical protein [Verrucomicrobiales bacterium]
MEQFLILNYPPKDLDEICRLVEEDDSFVALLTGEIYRIENYLLSPVLNEFSAVLDRNVYTRITTLVQGDTIDPKMIQDFRWAAAVLAFCQIVDIKFQYGSSLREYASKRGGKLAASDFESFYRADNCDPKAIIDFAVGRIDRLDISSISDLDPCETVPSPEEFEDQIYEFRLNYIFALKIALLGMEKEQSFERVIEFIDWMERDFICGAAALQFANLYFSPSRKRRMFKKKTLDDIKNAAWDLALIQVWRRCALKGNAEYDPVILISRDKVVKDIARRLVASDDAEFKSHLVDQWGTKKKEGEKIFSRYWQLHEKFADRGNRRELFPDEVLDAMTADLERQVQSRIEA